VGVFGGEKSFRCFWKNIWHNIKHLKTGKIQKYVKVGVGQKGTQ